jgi:asparagine synthase (glutamine-hydrolysing)
MSGIGGFIALDGAPANREWLALMSDALSAYGPDGVGTWCSGTAALLHGQLATTPEEVGKRQPVTDDATQLTLCLDGRLDNRAELFAWLRPREPLPETVPDSNLLLALFKHEGDDCVRRLVGDFSFAVWDQQKRRLFCARSVVGWRTFQWFCDGRLFVFGTDSKVVLAIPAVCRRVNEPLIGEILSLRFSSPTETLWQDIVRLRPGWALAVQDGPPRHWRWYKGPFAEQELPSDEAYAERFRELFDQSLRACTRASTPVAAQLSGGLDSSSIVCRGTQLYRAGGLAQSIRPVSSVAAGELHDETQWIQAVEGQLNIHSHRVAPVPYDWDNAEEWTRQSMHLPIRPNASGPLMAVCEWLQQEGIRVVLTGEGGDDWLNGSLAHWPDLLRRGRWIQLMREGMNAFDPNRPLWRKIGSAGFVGLKPWLSASHRRDLVNPHLRLGVMPDCIRPNWADRIALPDRLPNEEPLSGLSGFAQIQRSLRYDFARGYVGFDSALAYAASRRVEMRHPFHDRRLTEFIMGVPGDQLLRRGVRKHILREAMRGILPETVRNRSDKAWFLSPIINALTQRVMMRPIADLISVREGWLDGAALERTLEENKNWLTSGDTSKIPQGHLNCVWMAYSLDVWLREASGAR